MSNDPQRWLESDADPFLRSLLEAGRDDLPGAARMQAIVGKIGTGGGGGFGAEPTAAATKTATAAAALGKGLAVFAVLGAIGGAVLLGRPSEAPVPPPPVVMTPSVQASAAALESAPPPPPPPPSAARSAASTPSAALPRVSEDDPEAETLLLRRAQDSLASEPARSLALCREHARRFPRGLLAQEREVLAIDALIRLGRTSDATQRAQAFAAVHPSSPHRRRIDALLGAAVK